MTSLDWLYAIELAILGAMVASVVALIGACAWWAAIAEWPRWSIRFAMLLGALFPVVATKSDELALILIVQAACVVAVLAGVRLRQADARQGRSRLRFSIVDMAAVTLLVAFASLALKDITWEGRFFPWLRFGLSLGLMTLAVGFVAHMPHRRLRWLGIGLMFIAIAPLAAFVMDSSGVISTPGQRWGGAWGVSPYGLGFAYICLAFQFGLLSIIRLLVPDTRPEGVRRTGWAVWRRASAGVIGTAIVGIATVTIMRLADPGSPQRLLPEPNAFDLLVRVCRRYDRRPIDGVAIGLSELPQRVRSVESDLDQVQRVLDQPMVFELDHPFNKWGIIEFAGAFTARARLRASRRDLLGAVDDLRSSLLFAQRLSDGGLFGDQIAGIVIRDRTFEAIRRLPEWPYGEAYASLLHEFRTSGLRRDPWSEVEKRTARWERHRGNWYRRLVQSSRDFGHRPNEFDSARSHDSTCSDMILAELALGAYCRAHGEYPDTLQQLVPAHLNRIPWDEYGNAPLRYRRLPNGAYLIHSVWLNGIDEGGTRNDDRVAVSKPRLPDVGRSHDSALNRSRQARR